MTIDSQTILKRIDELLRYATAENASVNCAVRQMLYHGALGLLEMVYGPNSTQVTELKLIPERQWKSFHVNTNFHIDNTANIENNVFNGTIGVLWTLRSEVTQGLVSNLQQEAAKEVFVDFIVMSKQALEGGAKDVAAVLASAALEDALKRLCKMKGLDINDKTMSDVVNIMKANSLLTGTRAKLIGALCQLRNRAMHAEWEKVSIPEVQSMIAFTESFLTTEG
jgi:uncharacterized protein YutE (UPF0331/DUF86 family)